MEKINVFLFRVLCVYLYFAVEFELIDIPIIPYNTEYLFIIAGALVPFIYSLKKGKIKNKMVVFYEIAFIFIYFAYFEKVFIFFKEFLTNIFILNISYCLIIWLLLSYYDFEKKE